MGAVAFADQLAGGRITLPGDHIGVAHVGHDDLLARVIESVEVVYVQLKQEAAIGKLAVGIRVGDTELKVRFVRCATIRRYVVVLIAHITGEPNNGYRIGDRHGPSWGGGQPGHAVGTLELVVENVVSGLGGGHVCAVHAAVEVDSVSSHLCIHGDRLASIREVTIVVAIEQ